MRLFHQHFCFFWHSCIFSFRRSNWHKCLINQSISYCHFSYIIIKKSFILHVSLTQFEWFIHVNVFFHEFSHVQKIYRDEIIVKMFEKQIIFFIKNHCWKCHKHFCNMFLNIISIFVTNRIESCCERIFMIRNVINFMFLIIFWNFSWQWYSIDEFMMYLFSYVLFFNFFALTKLWIKNTIHRVFLSNFFASWRIFCAAISSFLIIDFFRRRREFGSSSLWRNRCLIVAISLKTFSTFFVYDNDQRSIAKIQNINRQFWWKLRTI